MIDRDEHLKKMIEEEARNLRVVFDLKRFFIEIE